MTCSHHECERIRHGDLVTVLVSADLLRRMVKGGWSEPLQISIEPPENGGVWWEMTFRQTLLSAAGGDDT